MIGPCVLSLALPYGSGPCRIAYVQGESLFAQECDRSGRTEGLAKPIRICRLAKDKNEDLDTMQWVTGGEISICRHHVVRGEETSSIWLVDARAGATPRKIIDGFDPCFAMHGGFLVYGTAPLNGEIWTLDLRTHLKLTVANHASAPTISRDGRRVAFVRVLNPDFDEAVEIRAFPDWRLISRLPPAVNPCELLFSPDGKYLAAHYHLSRPLTGHVIESLPKGPTITLRHPKGYVAPIVDDWSPDSKATLCEWRVPDPDNDGDWLSADIGFAPMSGGATRKLGSGGFASFAPDGQHALWLTDRKPGDLMWAAVSGGGAHRLIRRVDMYAIWAG